MKKDSSEEEGRDVIRAGKAVEQRNIDKIDVAKAHFKTTLKHLGLQPHIGEFDHIVTMAFTVANTLPPHDACELIRIIVSRLRPVFEQYPDLFDNAWNSLGTLVPSKYVSGELAGKRFVEVRKEYSAIVADADAEKAPLKDIVTQRKAATGTTIETETWLRSEEATQQRRERKHQRAPAVTEGELSVAMILPPKKPQSVTDYLNYETQYNNVLREHICLEWLSLWEAKARRPV